MLVYGPGVDGAGEGGGLFAVVVTGAVVVAIAIANVRPRAAGGTMAVMSLLAVAAAVGPAGVFAIGGGGGGVDGFGRGRVSDHS